MLVVVQGVNVADHWPAELDAAGPFLAVPKLDLHSATERFDHGIVVPIPHRFGA